MADFPPRLHVLLAREAPVGLVIRRGPSKRVCTLPWDRNTDQFTLGQWLRGRIYEDHCDISPDGKYFIYFALNGRWDDESQGAWTAISRVPYLKALAFFPVGHTWWGGGLFTGPRSYWLHKGCASDALFSSDEVYFDAQFQPGDYYSTYYIRLERDGWVRTDSQKTGRPETLEKPLSNGWFLLKLARLGIGQALGKSWSWDEHALLHPATGRTLVFPDWEWADVDRDRLVWAEKGNLYAARLSDEGVADETLLHDFDGMKFQRLKAPY